MARARRTYSHQGGLLGRKRNTSPRTKATLTTALTGANNDLKFTAQESGAAGNSLRIAYLNPGGTAARTITSTAGSNDIVVNLAVTAGAINASETATSIRNAINTHNVAGQKVEVELAPGNDGSGVVTALALTNLTGGLG